MDATSPGPGPSSRTQSATPRYSGRRVVVTLMILIALTLLFATLLRFAVRREEKSLPALATLPNINLKDSNGNTLQLRALQGKILFFDLHETDCKGPCEERNRQMAEIQYYNETVSDRIQQVTIQSGPFPLDLLKDQAEAHHARQSWHWFVVEPEEFEQLRKAVRPDPKASDLAIVDGNLQVRRRYLTSNKEDRRELMLDSRALMMELNRQRRAQGSSD